MKLSAADLFCGAGGTSTGALQAAEARGARLQLTAVNHWDVAIETHARNHPRARHLCSNVYQLAPRDAVPEGRLDLLMASPTCTFHSRARGGRPISRQQRWGRMTPTQVVRWADELKARILLVENVPEFVRWGPVHLSEPTQARCKRKRCAAEKPCKARAGSYFRAWVRKLQRLGFALEWRILNAADYGDATTRRRFFLIGRRDGIPLRWPEPTHAKDPAERGLFDGARARWRAAREVIDWGLLGASITQRPKPLSPKTLARIYAGMQRFRWPEPFLVVLRQHMAAQGLDVPLPTITAGGTHLGLAQPFMLPQRSDHEARRSTEDPTPTLTTVSRVGLIQPFMLPQHGGGAPRSTERPIPTVTTDGAHALLVPYHGKSQARSSEEPVGTLTTRDRFALVSPVTHHDGSRRTRSADDPLPTITGANRGELAFITPAFGERKGQAPRLHDVAEPCPTLCATGRLNLVQPGEVDVLFRMLQPHELSAAMGFPGGYDFAGNKTQRIRQIGNAVPVNTAAALVGALLEAS